MKKLLTSAFVITLAAVSGIILTAQLLGFTKAYYALPVFVLSLVLTMAFTFVLSKFSVNQFLIPILDRPDRLRSSKWVGISITTFGILLLVIVLLLPLIFWPFSSINSELNWDAGLYHFPKAAEMVISHSAWDLSIPYGEYPFGFESLIAFSFLISPGGYLIGLMHAIILLFFTLSLTFLLLRYTCLPKSFTFFIVVVLITSYDIVQTSLNPFGILRILAFTIGKNDFFLAAAMMSLLFFSPIGPDYPAHDLIGLGLSSALVASIKPNGLFLLLFVWALVLVQVIKQMRNHQWTRTDSWKWIGVIIINLVSVLWVLRNLLVQHTLITQESAHLQSNSILQNLNNPLFIHSLGLLSALFLGSLIFLSIVAIFNRKIHFSLPLTYLVLLFSFVATPAVLYFGSSGKDEAIIFWRLGVYLFAFEIPVLFLLCDPALCWFLTNKKSVIRNTSQFAIAFLFVAVSIFTCSRNYSRFIPVPGHDLVLKDQYQHSVGTNGYFSAYDYVRKNITNAVIWVDNGLPFYIYGESLSNSSTHLREADYQLFLATNWIGQSGFSENLDSKEWLSHWELVYADPEGRVYKNLEKK